ncbi:DUF3857 domain-containing protein [Sphingobacterium chungjuense]|uniref:DUF3857 domain-containing protein n=1 Tax=Sphingobacterium chungjuense TaxID=2675553 RepID=UPI0014092016|nr:DUF3857 domain-containing transglutaminase family protein [Sphingobacterium chungjuense]
MRVLLLVSIFLYSISTALPQDYSAEHISASLKNRAHAIIRDSKTVIDMRSAKDVSITIQKTITVLNKNGDKYGALALFYDKNTAIKSAKGEIYDEFGKLITKFSLNNFKDESAVSDFSLFEDSRVKYYTPQVTSYPYTIVYNYEVRNKQNLIIPEWKPVPDFGVAVAKSSYQFVCNPSDEVRVHTRNYTGVVEEVKNEKQKSLTWEIENTWAIRNEVYAPNRDTYFTSIKVAPKNFTYYNFRGAYDDWQGLGQLCYDYLLKDKRVLPPETIKTILNLVEKETSEKEKAKKIYDYFQKKTRYISVQIGIGGFQPIKASEVDRLGYGDCKALVNYMQALLEVVDIPSYYCVVEAGDEKNDLLQSFASMEQGNHAILCLPLENDTTWLECTSQDAPFGYLGSFTDDRWVFAYTKEGGKLLKTPKFDAEMSTQVRDAELILSKNGRISGNLTTNFQGAQFDNHFSLVKKSPTEKEKHLKYLYDINNLEFTSIDLSADNDVPLFIEKLGISIENYGNITDDRISFFPNLFNVQRTIPSVRNRSLPFEIKRGYIDTDSIYITFDEEIVPLIIPKQVNLESKFGSYKLIAKLVEGKLFYCRKLLIKDGIFPAEDYESYENFMQEVANNDKLRLTLSLKR